MKRLISIVSILIVACVFAEAQERMLRVMTYNLRFGELATTDELAAAIKEYNPDFVALQEVDVKTKRQMAKHQNGVDMLTEIAQKSGLFGYYGKTIDFAGGFYGIGILSRYPCEKLECIKLVNPGNTEQRAFLEGLFEIDSMHRVYFISTHLDVHDEATRNLQAKQILDHISNSKDPVILGGDFNSKPGSVTINFIAQRMADLTNADYTFPVENPNVKIDFLWGFPKYDFRINGTFVVPMKDKAVSDHKAVVSDIILK